MKLKKARRSWMTVQPKVKTVQADFGYLIRKWLKAWWWLLCRGWHDLSMVTIQWLGVIRSKDLQGWSKKKKYTQFLIAWSMLWCLDEWESLSYCNLHKLWHRIRIAKQESDWKRCYPSFHHLLDHGGMQAGWRMNTRPWLKIGKGHTKTGSDCSPRDGVSKFENIPNLRHDDFASSTDCKQLSFSPELAPRLTLLQC